MDFRFMSDIRAFLDAMGLKNDYDVVSLAGSAKNIADPYDGHDKDLVMRQIEISKKLHSISQVILLNHLDCGAYGKGTFKDAAEERQRHVRDLAHGASHIMKRVEGVSVLKVLARIDGQGKVDFEKII